MQLTKYCFLLAFEGVDMYSCLKESRIACSGTLYMRLCGSHGRDCGMIDILCLKHDGGTVGKEKRTSGFFPPGHIA